MERLAHILIQLSAKLQKHEHLSYLIIMVKAAGILMLLTENLAHRMPIDLQMNSLDG